MNLTSTTTRRRTRFARSATALALILACSSVAACSSSSSSSSTDESTSPSPSTSAPSSPFSAELVGPESAEAGKTITATLSNVGRLPDAYQLSVTPEGAAVIDEANLRLSPGESAEVSIAIERMPFVVSVESVGGGSGEELTRLDVK